MRVLETRTTPEGFKRRRYRSAGGVQHWTIEVPMTVWAQLNGQGRGRDRLAAFERKQARASKRVQALGLVRAGRSFRAVARLLDVSPSTVRRWAKEQTCVSQQSSATSSGA